MSTEYRNKKIQKLQIVEDAILEMISNGASYGLSGSHNKVNIALEKLEMLASRLKREIAIIDGWKTSTRPNFSGN